MRLITLLAAIAVAGCTDVTGPDIASSPAPISAASPIALTTSVSPTTLAPGDSVTITVTLTNLSDTTVTLAAGGCTLPFVVSTELGRNAGPDVTGLVCPAVLIVITLEPKQSKSIPQTWDGMLVGQSGERTRLPAGNYEVRGSAEYGAVRSNPAAQLTVLP